jgi:hypothetical protein
MKSKVTYPDDYIRGKRSIIAAAELTYVYKDDGEFVVEAGEDTYVLPYLDDALNLAANHILGDCTLDSVEFITCEDGVWRPDIRVLHKELEEVGRRHRK